MGIPVIESYNTNVTNGSTLTLTKPSNVNNGD